MGEGQHSLLSRRRHLLVANAEGKVVAAPDPDLPDPLLEGFGCKSAQFQGVAKKFVGEQRCIAQPVQFSRHEEWI